jgi:hypothetical protein
MRTLTMNEIEEVGGGPAVVLAPWFVSGCKWAITIFAAAVIAGAGEELGSQLAEGMTGNCGK